MSDYQHQYHHFDERVVTALERIAAAFERIAASQERLFVVPTAPSPLPNTQPSWPPYPSYPYPPVISFSNSVPDATGDSQS